jgi:di/tricarboxylate transporter
MQILQWSLIGVFCILLGFVITNRLRMDLAAILLAGLLGVLQLAGWGVLGTAHTPKNAILAVSGFSQPVVITLLSLFIITRGLDKSGITRQIANYLIRIGGKSESRFIFLFATVTAFLSLFMNNLAAAALVLPSAMEAARRTGIKPSKLLIPVAYGSLLGGSATYFTTANIIMSDLLGIANPPQHALGILDFTPTGGLIAIAGILFLLLLGRVLLPNRESSSGQIFANLTGSELEDIYQLGERLWEAKPRLDSIIVGKTLTQTEIGQTWGVTVAAVKHEKEEFELPSPNRTIQKGDTLILIGREEKILPLDELGLEIRPLQQNKHLSPHGVIFAEVILNPHSGIEGRTLKEIGFRQKFELTVVALKRFNRSYRTDVGDIQLKLGDSLLVIGPIEQLKVLKKSPEFILFEPNLSDQPVNTPQAIISIGITLAAIGASIAGVPVYLSMLVGAILTILFNIVTMEEAYQSIEWPAIFVIAGMYAVSLALVQTGLAEQLGNQIFSLFTPLGPLGVAAGAYLMTVLLTQVIGGQVSALVIGPITISAAISLGINPQAVAVATAIGCSASFLTPLAHPVNILMIAPANYKFGDFFRVGWLLTILSFIMLLIGLSIFWKL